MRKMGFICLAIVLSMGMLGVGYSLWSKQLLVSGEVNTGSFGGRFSQAVSNDPGTLDDPISQGSWSLVLDVPEWDGTRDDHHTATTVVSGQGTKQLTVTLSDVYVSYRGSVGVTIENSGSIPLKVKTVDVEVSGSPGDPDGDYLNIILAGALVESNHVQIESNEEVLGSAYFHPFGSAPVGNSYTVTITITVVIWDQV